jgi:hypothetical protein
MLIWGDTLPIEGQWDETDLRSFSSIPFTVETVEYEYIYIKNQNFFRY